MVTNHQTNKGGNMNYKRRYNGVQLYIKDNCKKEDNGIFQK